MTGLVSKLYNSETMMSSHESWSMAVYQRCNSLLGSELADI